MLTFKDQHDGRNALRAIVIHSGVCKEWRRTIKECVLYWTRTVRAGPCPYYYPHMGAVRRLQKHFRERRRRQRMTVAEQVAPWLYVRHVPGADSSRARVLMSTEPRGTAYLVPWARTPQFEPQDFQAAPFAIGAAPTPDTKGPTRALTQKRLTRRRQRTGLPSMGAR